MLHEVFLNPGLYLLFGGIVIGFISGSRGRRSRKTTTTSSSPVPGLLCLFLLEMGMTACRELKDLKNAGWGFIVFGLLAPEPVRDDRHPRRPRLQHVPGGTHFELGTYVLFAVLCGAASYIAVPAVQRLAIPEASPTLPLAASLGLTFSYNVTIGIPVYIEIAKAITKAWPVR